MRFTAFAAASLCAIVLFSVVHVTRLNVHLLDYQSIRARAGGRGAGVGEPSGGIGMAERGAGVREPHTRMMANDARIERAAGEPHAVAGAEESPIFGFPRSAFVRVADEAEIRSRDCPGRRPFHSLLTVQDREYMQWQTYLAYYHFVKQQKADYCTDMVAITRLLASPDGRPDGLMSLMPTHVSAQLGHDKTRGFQVINRPWSVLQFLGSAMYKERVLEDYVLILEGDHILLKPIPNRATPDKPVGFFFPYMSPEQVPDHPRIVAKWYKGPREHVQPTGPSPALLHKKMLELVTNDWYELSVELKRDRETDACFGWVLEMWGWTITCARHGITHEVWQQFQIEPSATWRQNVSGEDPYIYHYTFGHEYTREGYPMVGQQGEWSFDKRQYFGAFPASPMAEPPECAYEAAKVLVSLFNEGSAASPPWQAKAVKAQGDTTRKRLKPPPDESAPAYRSVVGVGPWELVQPAWKGREPNAFFFFAKGRAHTPLGSATWSLSKGGDEIVFNFCRSDTLKVEKSEDGRTVLRGSTYTFALAKGQQSPEGIDPAMWSTPLAKRIIGAGPYAWGARRIAALLAALCVTRALPMCIPPQLTRLLLPHPTL